MYLSFTFGLFGLLGHLCALHIPIIFVMYLSCASSHEARIIKPDLMARIIKPDHCILLCSSKQAKTSICSNQ